VELPTSSCHGVLYPRYYGLVGTSSRKLPGGSRRVVLLSPRVWKGCQRVRTRDWYLMHYSTPSVTGGQKHTHTHTAIAAPATKRWTHPPACRHPQPYASLSSRSKMPLPPPMPQTLWQSHLRPLPPFAAISSRCPLTLVVASHCSPLLLPSMVSCCIHPCSFVHYPLCCLQLPSLQIGKGTELQVPTWHSGMCKAFRIHVGSALEAIEKKGLL
jgi:hypothetical protein